MEKYYECRKCKKMTYSTPHLNDWLCLQCRLLQLRMVYEEKRATTLTKKELTAEAKKLRAKCEKIFKEEETYKSDLSGCISSKDNKEEDYVPPMPEQRKSAKRKFFSPHKSHSGSSLKKKKVSSSSTQIPASPRHGQTQTTPKTTKSRTPLPIKEREKQIPLKRVNFQKSYKGPKRYYTDIDFNYQFDSSSI